MATKKTQLLTEPLVKVKATTETPKVRPPRKKPLATIEVPPPAPPPEPNLYEKVEVFAADLWKKSLPIAFGILLSHVILSIVGSW